MDLYGLHITLVKLYISNSENYCKKSKDFLQVWFCVEPDVGYTFADALFDAFYGMKRSVYSMKHYSRIIAAFLAAIMLTSSVGYSVAADGEDATGTDTSVQVRGAADPEDVEEYLKAREENTVFSKFTYTEYIAQYADVPDASEVITFGAADPAYLTASSGKVTVSSEYDETLPENGIAGQSLYMGDSEDGETVSVTWTVKIANDGLFVIDMLYYTVPGKNNSIERSLYIDDKSPFTEAGGIVFPRVWKDSDEGITLDQDGNDIRASSEEVNGWYDGKCIDTSGKYGEYFKFYLSAGTHTIRLETQKEAVIFNRISLSKAPTLISYAELQQQYAEKGYKLGTSSANDYALGIKDDEAKNNPMRRQAEDMHLKSSATIYPEWDRTSPLTYPSSSDVIKLNQIKSDKFSAAYQWIEWEFDVEEAGLYNINARFKQTDRDGAFCNRTVYVNGEVPCEEAKYVHFDYDGGWQVSTLSAADGTPFLFYFKEGKNTVRLEVTLGEFADLLAKVDNTIYSLNNCYRGIMMITGSSPDTFRDYSFDTMIPETIAEMAEDLEILKQVVADIKQLTGEPNGSFTSSFNTLINDLEIMTENPGSIAKKLENFKSNLGTISTWLVNATAQPVGFDWIQISSAEEELPKANAGFFENLSHQCKMFASSFYMDYNNVGRSADARENTRDVTVWVATSQDQSQIIRRLIDNSLSKNTDLKVNLKLVSPGTILPSITAGIGPDVVLGIGNSEPLNYAIRGAVMDVSQFNDPDKVNFTFDEVMSRFNPTAYTPYQYKGKTYGVPETFSFGMLFYRKDVLSELEMEVPKTWTEVYDCIVKLNMNGLYFGITDVFGTLLYQNGGSYYNEDGSASALDTALAISCFKQYTEFFTSYGCLVTFDFSNRFRTGEMPLGLADYTAYNQLSVFAPEIKGLWGFTDIPGIEQEDGTINHTGLSAGTASVIISNAKDPEAAWDFLSWWTDTSTQVYYGQEIESILGTSARYNTANLEAVAQLPWTSSDYKAIYNQWQSARSLPEYPGSYILGRYLSFAFQAVVNQDADPGEELLDNVRLINEELTRKQKEFADNENK